MALDAVYARNTLQFVSLGIFNLLFLVYSVVQITEIKKLQNEHLKSYLHQRGLSKVVYPLVKEIHFTIGEKKLYAIGFENFSGGWELRNSFYKGSVLKKDISITRSAFRQY